jgi:hypothetical protein
MAAAIAASGSRFVALDKMGAAQDAVAQRGLDDEQRGLHAVAQRDVAVADRRTMLILKS